MNFNYLFIKLKLLKQNVNELISFNECQVNEKIYGGKIKKKEKNWINLKNRIFLNESLEKIKKKSIQLKKNV